MIILHGVSKTGKQEKVLNDISLTVPDGKVTVLLGPSGAGKSTICDVACGLMIPDSGKVTIDEYDMVLNPIEAKRHIGYMQQNPAMFRDMTPRTQLKFIGQTRDMNSRTLSESVESILKQTRLKDVADMPIKFLSEAYLQRLSIAQAIMGNVTNIVLDAPSKPLDAKQTLELRAILKEIIRGHAVLLATSNLTEAMALGQTVYVLNHGKIVGRTDMEKLALLEADEGETIIQVAADVDAAQAAAKKAGFAPTDCSQIDGIARINVRTENIEGKKRLFQAFSDARLPIVDMRPASADIEKIISKLQSDSFPAEGAEME